MPKTYIVNYQLYTNSVSVQKWTQCSFTCTKKNPSIVQQRQKSDGIGLTSQMKPALFLTFKKSHRTEIILYPQCICFNLFMSVILFLAFRILVPMVYQMNHYIVRQ